MFEVRHPDRPAPLAAGRGAGGDAWRFAIDVGGTFTDVVAVDPSGQSRTFKLLSSGVFKGVVESVEREGRAIVDSRRRGDPERFWTGYPIRFVSVDGSVVDERTIASFDAARGLMTLDAPLSDATFGAGTAYEIVGPEEPPVLAIRYLMGLTLGHDVGPVDLRLGTTRATNALLERKGARTAFVTTAGFADVLRIGYQDRPALFDLHIRKRRELASCEVEIDARMAADGAELKSVDEAPVRRTLQQLADDGIEAVGICLLHAHVNDAHERVVADLARSVGFRQVSVSSRVGRMERIVPRGDTTVVDAYLSPVIREYVASIRRSMPQARFRLMTSAGGLMEADSAGGKDTILSGPAGGVVGCRAVASRAGFARAIGFDMGGTSTDVCRAAGAYEYRHETVQDGVRIATPMLAIETVAAGGGSICGFDGQRLTVGPESAGADPGPACYGRGGPATITDANLLLGRIPAARFPFRLDRAAAVCRFEALAGEVARGTGGVGGAVGPGVGGAVGPGVGGAAGPGGAVMSVEELAAGFIRVANENMAAAIRRISIAKGIDVRDHALVLFGGAGGQHACAVAKLLGMTTIIAPPEAGVLSAYGIGRAPLKRVVERSVKLTLRNSISEPRASARAESAGGDLAQILKQLTADAQRFLHDDGATDADIQVVRRSVEACYAAQSSTLTVDVGTPDEMCDRFEQAHRRQYGYTHKGRAIEVRVARVEAVAGDERGGPANQQPPGGHKPAAGSKSGDPRPAASTTPAPTRVAFDGAFIETPVLFRESLSAGDVVAGPAIVAEDVGTLIIEPGWSGVVAESGDIVLTNEARAADARMGATATAGAEPAARAEVDPIDLALFSNRFTAIAEQMGVTLQRTALSTNVKERLDFSCAVFDAAGNLVVNAPHIPVHLGGMSDCVKLLCEDVGAMRPGDVFITNDPYRGGSHLNDVTVVTPVFAEYEAGSDQAASSTSGGGVNQGGDFARAQARDSRSDFARAQARGSAPDFFVASRAHHAEIGGTRPGSMPPDSTRLDQEGVLIRALRWMDGGQARPEALRQLLTAGPYPSRSPDQNIADIEAQVAANQMGVTRLIELMQSHGRQTVIDYMGHIQSAAERMAAAAITRLSDGVHRFEDSMDDGTTIRLAITIDGDRATFDFSGTDAVHPGNLNANASIVRSAVLYCLRCLIADDIPLNAGVLSKIEIALPECFLNPPRRDDPRDCAAVVGGNVETSQRIVDCIFGALGVAAGSQGTMNNLLMGNARFGYYETICGGAGAGPGYHGADAVHTHMTNTRLTDPEVLESRVPVRLRRFAIRRGSGGGGRWRGGDGVVREIEFLEDLDVSILSHRRVHGPYGMAGGGDGKPGRNVLIRAADGPAVEGEAGADVLPHIAYVSARRGDRLIVETPGGGGYGA